MVYRYTLHRAVDGLAANGEVVWVMHNPSTADERADDPTIRRVKDYSARWGFAGLSVVNLYAARATKPSEIRHMDDPVGPLNDMHLSCVIGPAEWVVCAWGALNDPAVRARADVVWARFLASKARVTCLGLTMSGEPRHPLFVHRSAAMQPYSRTGPGEVAYMGCPSCAVERDDSGPACSNCGDDRQPVPLTDLRAAPGQ